MAIHLLHRASTVTVFTDVCRERQSRTEKESSSSGSKKYYHDSYDDGYDDVYMDGDYDDDRYDSDDDYAAGVDDAIDHDDEDW